MPRKRSRSWLTTTAPPRQSASTSPSKRRAAASRLLVGSSSRIRSGCSSSRRARARRVAWPPLRLAAGRLRSRPDRPTSARMTSRWVWSIQSASARSVAPPSPRSMRSSRARASATPSTSAADASAGGARAWRSMPMRPRRVTAPDAGSSSPSSRRSRLVLPTPLRPTRPVRSRPKARVRFSKRVRPSGVRQDNPSTVISADMADLDAVAVRGEADVRRLSHRALHHRPPPWRADADIGRGRRRAKPGRRGGMAVSAPDPCRPRRPPGAPGPCWAFWPAPACG